ncbi:MAG: methyltransferase domain-containing protein [Firmicutes bacterium]|nr:methyltransferase domain-containing protein [Bacillota bacterium]
MNSLFCCPVCGEALAADKQEYCCANGHRFDRAAKGYVNLLPANRKHSAEPGDDPESLRARRAFLQTGHYRPLADALCTAAGQYCGAAPAALDCCCGEGYYTRLLAQTLWEQKPGARLAAFDISRQGVKMACSRSDPTEYAVASVFHIPAAAERFDLAVLCFAPFCGSELARVLKPGGVLLGVIPGARHLFAMKNVLYREPYENDEQGFDCGAFTLHDTVRIRDRIRLSQPELANLFRMTPYFCRCEEDAKQRLLALPELDTEIDFVIRVLRKN